MGSYHKASLYLAIDTVYSFCQGLYPDISDSGVLFRLLFRLDACDYRTINLSGASVARFHAASWQSWSHHPVSGDNGSDFTMDGGGDSAGIFIVYTVI